MNMNMNMNNFENFLKAVEEEAYKEGFEEGQDLYEFYDLDAEPYGDSASLDAENSLQNFESDIRCRYWGRFSDDEAGDDLFLKLIEESTSSYYSGLADGLHRNWI